MAHLRFTPREYRVLCALCRDVHLRDESFPIFRYFLAEVLHEKWPALAGRIALLGERQLRLLFRHLQARLGLKPAGTARAGLSAEEFRAVAWAAQCFVLCGGRRSGFRAFLCQYFRGASPALADRLAGLSDREVGKLYRRARRPARWWV